VEVVASLSQGRTAAAQCGLFTHKSVPVIFEPPCIKFFFLLELEAASCASGVVRSLARPLTGGKMRRLPRRPHAVSGNSDRISLTPNVAN